MTPEYEFLAPVLLTAGGVTAHKVPLPAEIAAPLREAKTRRIIGTLNGEPFRLALHRDRSGFWFLALGKGRMKALGLETGALVEVALSADPDPDHVELGAELAAALEASPEARAAWDTLTPGKRRNLAFTVNHAKRSSTREGYAADLVRALADGTHPAVRGR